MSRFDRGRRQSSCFSCKTLAPAATRTKTQAGKKRLPNSHVNYAVGEGAYRGKITLGASPSMG